MSSSKPWLSWPVELPTTNEIRECKEYKRLHDHDFYKALRQEIRAQIFERASTALPSLTNACALLQGGTSADFELYDTDVDKTEFRQESFFRYVFQTNIPDCYGLLDLARKESVLFVPWVSDDAERWNGERYPLEHYVQRYGVDHAYWVHDLDKVLKERGLKHLYLLQGENADSGIKTRTTATFDGIKDYETDLKHLHPLLVELRVFKTQKEIEVLRLGNLISSQAHVYVMRHIKAGMTELQLEALYKAWVGFHGGCRHMAYTCICGSGGHGAILHYGHAGRPNDRILQANDTIVLDMGAEYHGYATDITRSYAVSGKFTEDQRAVHNAVYAAQQAVFKALKPGVSWPEMHRLAERVILEHLIGMGILRGDLNEMVEANIASLFMPHGLGHLLGLDVHDVGGYEDGTGRSKEPGLCWLRCGRHLQAGMFITVEPGLYFNEKWILKGLTDPKKAQYVNMHVLQRFFGTGGCRLEDDVLITETGCENLTVLPVAPEDIEEVMALARKQ